MPDAKRPNAWAPQVDLPRGFTYESVGVDPTEAKRIERKLLGKKRAISKHCGGIVMFTRKLPKSLISEDNQILLDKHEVEDSRTPQSRHPSQQRLITTVGNRPAYSIRGLSRV